ncbi:hypothetical protein NMG60_11003565 [Bertholletia excelsa]
MGGVAWSEEEDKLLKKCVELYGEGKWRRIPVLAGLNRSRKSCRLRWLNYLRPNINRGAFKQEEADLMIKLHKVFGNKWSVIASKLPGRTANDVKNYWNCHLSKKMNKQEEGEAKTNIAGNLATSTTCSNNIATGQTISCKEGEEDDSGAAMASEKSLISNGNNNHLGDSWHVEYDFGGGMGISPLHSDDLYTTCDMDNFIFDIDLWMN